jgi:hypothetical protein
VKRYRKANGVDSLGGIPLFIVAAADGKSIQVSRTPLTASVLNSLSNLHRTAGSGRQRNRLEMEFSGTAISGPLSGKRLERVTLLKDFWFDWKNYHPHTSVFNPGLEKSP